jgi:hypothetical protein
MSSPSHSRARLGGAALAFALIVPALALVMSQTAATAATPDDDELAAGKPVRFVMGFKAGGGGTLWSGPDDTVLRTFSTGPRDGERFDLPIFDETRGGYTMSAGFFLQGIFYEHLGLEIGFHFVQHTMLEEIEWTYTEQRGNQINTFLADSDQQLSWTAFHLPILIKAMVDTGATRVSLGIGPEFSFTSYSRSSFKITDGGLRSTSTDPNDTTFPFRECFDGAERLPGTRCNFTRVGTQEKDSVYLAVVFGIEIDAGDFIVPIDIHWSYNFSQPKDYLERVVVDPASLPTEDEPDVRPTGIELRTRDSMYGGIRIGLAYQFK